MAEEKKTPAPVPRKKKSLKSFFTNLAVGGTAAAIAKTLNAPLERVKLINQTNPGRYSGLVDCLVSIPKEEGMLAYWRGNGANVLRYFPTQALNFAFKDEFRHMFMPLGAENYSKSQAFFLGLLAGGGAGASSLAFVYPLDLARTRMTTDLGKGGNKTYSGLGDCLKKTFQEGGVKSLYKGFGISVMGIIPYRAVYFGGFDFLKMVFLKDDSSFWMKWGVSQGNTIIAQYITYPIDTIRRYLMVSGKVDKSGKKAREFKGTLDCARTVYKEQGFVGLYRGSLANTYRATGAALCMVFYDTIKTKMNL
mmetsp:Transcript_12595/g.18884  ORF Transcript_12595/g.18884 Transcript_12595/m.18884 type:complete len:307 (-) Transcript_12595:51-971(-)